MPVERTRRESVAVSVGDHMLAAVYFDLIVPLHSCNSIPSDLCLHIGQTVLPQHMGTMLASLSASQPRNLHGDASAFITFLNTLASDTDLFQPDLPMRDADRFFAYLRNSFAVMLSPLLARLGFDTTPLLSSQAVLAKGIRDRLADQGVMVDYTEMVEVKIDNLRTISTEHAQWEQVSALRQDLDALRRVRNIRRLFAEDYQGKSRQFIADDIQARIEQYEAAAKKYGFELGEETVAMIRDPAILVCFAHLIPGGAQDVAQLLASLAAVAFHGVRLAKRMWLRSEDRKQDPVALVIEARDSMQRQLESIR